MKRPLTENTIMGIGALWALFDQMLHVPMGWWGICISGPIYLGLLYLIIKHNEKFKDKS